MDVGRFAAARLWAASKVPYLASALFACTPTDAPSTGTIAADRSWRLHADPDVVATLEPQQLGRLLVHLVGHLVRDHADRADTLLVDRLSAAWWLRCTDAEINDDLAVAGLLPPVARDLPTDLGASDNQLAETYFGRAPAAQDSEQWDCGSCADGQPRPWDGAGDQPGLTGEQADRLRHAVATEIQQAHERDPGSVPGGWLRWAESVRASRTDWRRELAAEVRRAVAAAAGSVDYTYRRPSRRSHTAQPGPRPVLPSLYRPVPSVAIVCDTSGSMDDELLARVLAEVDAIVARAGLRGAGVTALAVDTEVHAVRRVRRAAEVVLSGGGGTDMGAGIAAALTRRPRPEVVIVLTDGFTPWPAAAPANTRVVVGLLESPFGETEPAPEWARSVLIPMDEIAT